MIFNKRLIIILFILTSLSCTVFANNLESETYQGVSVEEYNLNEDANLMNSNNLDLQEISANNNENQIGSELVSVEDRKMYVLNKAMLMWAMIGGLFVIVFDILKAVMYLVEVYFMFLILFKLFPTMLLKIKESITEWYLERI